MPYRARARHLRSRMIASMAARIVSSERDDTVSSLETDEHVGLFVQRHQRSLSRAPAAADARGKSSHEHTGITDTEVTNMPGTLLSLSRRSRSRRGATAAVLSVLVALIVGPGVAAACPAARTSEAFAQFGDDASYALAPGGSFEEGTPGWSLRNAKVAPGNESYNIVPGSHSLAIEPSGAAVTPWLCISGEYPAFRLFARQRTGDSTARLAVSLRWLDVLGLVSVDHRVGSLPGRPPWAPSPALEYGDSVPLWLPGTSGAVQLVFESSGNGTWAIDDVFIDPYSR